MKNNFLVELLTEELPPNALEIFSQNFGALVCKKLREEKLSFDESIQIFATPRRLGLLIAGLSENQPDQFIEKKGPALSAAFDPQGRPTQACEKFAASCGITVDALSHLETDKGTWIAHRYLEKGNSVDILLPLIIRDALSQLPMPKRMRWGEGEAEFIRPLHGLVMLYGDRVIPATLFGCAAGRETQGHRFHAKKPVHIKKADSYIAQMEKEGHVIVSFETRKQLILQQIHAVAGLHGKAFIADPLLDEVTALVEWPVAFSGQFDKDFLTIPKEALILVMRNHQRYFPVVDADNQLLPYFVGISNIESQDKIKMVRGYETVLKARLADAAFFYETDQKKPLEHYLPDLKNIVFQTGLGSLYDKTQRLIQLCEFLAEHQKINIKDAMRAAELSKTDLLTHMVGEFPELQGTIGKYYALQAGEENAVAIALREQYQPRFAKDTLPQTLIGSALAIADRIDTLVGLFGLNRLPTGDKDPLGLRRAALGVLRILIENEWPLDLKIIFKKSIEIHGDLLKNKNILSELLLFMQERLRAWMAEQGITADIFNAVFALEITSPYHFNQRIWAVKKFKRLEEANALAAANKRVNHLLERQSNLGTGKLNADLFETSEEKNLAAALIEKTNMIEPLYKTAQYEKILSTLATLRQPIDQFFDHVLVMTDNEALRHNRLLLLMQLRELFLQVADISLLQSENKS